MAKGTFKNMPDYEGDLAAGIRAATAAKLQQLLPVWERECKKAGLDPNKPPQTLSELLTDAKKLTTYNSDGSIKQLGLLPNGIGANYGGGADFPVVNHVSLRAEYRGLVYNAPDFGLSSLNTNTVTHAAQPSAGIVFRF